MAAPVLRCCCPGKRWALACIDRGSRHGRGAPPGSWFCGKRGQRSVVQQLLSAAQKLRKGYTISYHYSPLSVGVEDLRDWGDGGLSSPAFNLGALMRGWVLGSNLQPWKHKIGPLSTPPPHVNCCPQIERYIGEFASVKSHMFSWIESHADRRVDSVTLLRTPAVRSVTLGARSYLATI